MDSEQKTSIRQALEDCRKQGLASFVAELMPLLNHEGFTLQDLMDALASWTDQQETIPNSVTKHLEDAVTELSKKQ